MTTASRGISAGARPFPQAGDLKTIGQMSTYLNTLGNWIKSAVDGLNYQAKTIPYASVDDLPPLAGGIRFIYAPDDPTYGQVILFNGPGTSGTDTGWYRLVASGTASGSSVSIPAGGTTSQVLGKHSTADYDMAWQTPHYVPAGGGSHAFLGKNTTADYDHSWLAIHEVPAGGTTSQALRKTGTADYAASWVDVHEVPAGGGSADVLTKTGTADYAAAWATPHYVPAGGAAKQSLIKNSTADYDASWSNSLGTTTVDALISIGNITAGGTSSYADFSSTAAYLGEPVQLGNQTTTATIGTAGTASALPANPSGYLKIKINGANFSVPFYAQ